MILDWKKYTETATLAAAEGIVMLSNDGGVLPLGKDSKVALFGRMQNNYYKSGTGSGGMVNVDRVINIREGLEEAGVDLDKELLAFYEEFEEKNPPLAGIGWGQEHWSQPEAELDDGFVEKMSGKNGTAVIIIARTAGEDRDNSASEGAYYLSSGEEKLLSQVTGYFKKTVVLLNTGNIIDMSFVERYKPSSVLYVWQGGMIGGRACARVLTGEVNPSGALTDTIAKSIGDYPSDPYFGKGDQLTDFYSEDIYVGYRYFSTFAPDKVLYPFGYGLSYTDFEIRAGEILLKDGKISVSVSVKNTGSLPGKKSVIIYFKGPEGKLGKPQRSVFGFSKTRLLAPDEEEKLVICESVRRIASFDDDNRADLKNGWIIEAGCYEFYAGGDFINAARTGEIVFEKSGNIEELSSALKPVREFERFVPLMKDGKISIGFEKVPLREKENIEDRFKYLDPEIPQTGDKGIRLIDVKEGRASLDDFIAQIDDEDLCLIVRGEGMSSPKVTLGTAAAFGGISKELKALGIPALCCSDGPSGMRIDSGKKAFSLPNGTCIASSFNKELTRELFVYFGIEMTGNRIDNILGPGINIHRHPLNGRNFEYFSEDPVVTGDIASAMLDGLHESGVTGTVKHFCVNNRETKRRFMDSVVSERALREIYLRGFEIAVRKGGARSIMTCYNKVNGVYGSSNYELNTEILRRQWGFEGIEMTDWWANLDLPGSEPGLLRNHAIMVRSQNDIYMVCSSVERDKQDNANTFEELKKEDGIICRAELQRNARNILRYAMTTPAMDRLSGAAEEVEHIDCPFNDHGSKDEAGVFFDIGEDPVIDVLKATDTAVSKEFTFGITCDDPGIYTLDFTASSELDPLAQIPMTFYITSIPVNVVTWNGTKGAEDARSAEIMLRTKHVVCRLEFKGEGVTLKQIRLRKTGSIPDARA